MSGKAKTWVEELSDDGEFIREEANYRHWIGKEEKFPLEKNRYHLYLAHACPWACRIAVLRGLKGIDDEWLSVCYVDPVFAAIDDHGSLGWVFSEEYPDKLYGKKTLREVYLSGFADHDKYSKSTTPVLWDKKLKCVVNNESSEIIQMINSYFNEYCKNPKINMRPEATLEEMEKEAKRMYAPINNGVYRSGFSKSQKAYEEVLEEMFETLDYYEELLGKRRFVCGDRFTEADLRLFMTLSRFDPVYFIHFKCAKKRLEEYENLFNYVRDCWQLPGVKENINMKNVLLHYYKSHPTVNPSLLVPPYPLEKYEMNHGRAEKFPSKINCFTGEEI